MGNVHLAHACDPPQAQSPKSLCSEQTTTDRRRRDGYIHMTLKKLCADARMQRDYLVLRHDFTSQRQSQRLEIRGPKFRIFPEELSPSTESAPGAPAPGLRALLSSRQALSSAAWCVSELPFLSHETDMST